ncbi:MAG: divalent-cation tolerance protein CutA [Alphaproteobacteria bacterium]|nr:divalent-cation tolerance protein CutA [Alphaproteobacteria bacterium]
MSACFVYITTGDAAEARKIGRILVEERLAACANVQDRVTSIYRWEGAVQEDVEAVLIAKSVTHRLPALIDRVKALHSYDCPCIVAWPLSAGNPDFFDWLATESAEHP